MDSFTLILIMSVFNSSSRAVLVLTKLLHRQWAELREVESKIRITLPLICKHGIYRQLRHDNSYIFFIAHSIMLNYMYMYMSYIYMYVCTLGSFARNHPYRGIPLGRGTSRALDRPPFLTQAGFFPHSWAYARTIQGPSERTLSQNSAHLVLINAHPPASAHALDTPSQIIELHLLLL